MSRLCDPSGEPLCGRHATTLRLKAPLRRGGLPPIRFHDLPHSFATLQLAAGTNPKIVSDLLDHKEIAITLDRYSHALPTIQADAMGRLDEVLGRSPLETPTTIPPTAPVDHGERQFVREPSGDKGPDKGPNAVGGQRRGPI